MILAKGRADWRLGIAVAAGPCAVESREQINNVAARVAQAGAKIVARRSVQAAVVTVLFQGLGEEGLQLMREPPTTTGCSS